jgi:hypothetical protein
MRDVTRRGEVGQAQRRVRRRFEKQQLGIRRMAAAMASVFDEST